MSKAFDRVDHEILCSKLIERGFPNIFVSLISNWYRNQNVKVSFNGEHSKEWKITCGVRQGGILSPLLFNVYIDSILNKISKEKIGCQIGIQKSNIIAYADDIVIMAPSMTGLKYLIDVLDEEVNRIKLKINFNKSECIKFTRQSNQHLIDKFIKIGENNIKFVSEVKYLGYYIDFNLCNETDIRNNLNSFYKQFNCTLRKFSKLDSDVLLKLFKTYASQFYGSPLWFRNFKCTKILKQFAVAYHKAIKKILKVSYGSSNHDCCEILNLLTFNHFINFSKIRFVYRIFTNCCDFIQSNYMFLKSNSMILNDVNDILKRVYGVNTDLLSNDLDAIQSRIIYIDRREPRSNYISIL